MKKFFNKKTLVLFIILLLATAVRIYKINSPLADKYSWRQADTASVAKNLVKDFNLLYPKYHDLSNIPSGKENPKGWRMVEFPLYNAIFAYLYKLNPSLPIEVYGRIVSIFFTLLSISILYYLLLKEVSLYAAFIGGLTYALLPFIVFFTRVVLPEPTAVSLAMISIFFAYLFSKEKHGKLTVYFYYFLSLFFFSLSLLVKPTTIFFGIIIAYLFLKRYNFFAVAKLQFWGFFLLASIPFLLWRLHISAYPEGIPAFQWLTTSVNTSEGLKSIFFKPAFFRWIFFERINNLILGGYLTFFLLYGIIKNKNGLFISFLLSSLAYLFTFQGGNVQHEYYQTLIFPTIAVFVGIGAEKLKQELKFKPIAYSIFFLIFVFSFYFSFYKVKEYYRTPPDLINYASIIKTFTKPKDLIITDTMGDTTLLYLSERKGSPAPYKNLKEFAKKDYKYFITTNPQTAEKILEGNPDFKAVFKSEKLYIIKLR